MADLGVDPKVRIDPFDEIGSDTASKVFIRIRDPLGRRQPVSCAFPVTTTAIPEV
jgi:hypothetical protein